MSDAVKKVEAALAKRLKTATINPESDFRELGLDSLDVVELLLDLEDQLNVKFTSDELKQFKKVSDLYNAIDAKLKK